MEYLDIYIAKNVPTPIYRDTRIPIYRYLNTKRFIYKGTWLTSS